MSVTAGWWIIQTGRFNLEVGFEIEQIMQLFPGRYLTKMTKMTKMTVLWTGYGKLPKCRVKI